LLDESRRALEELTTFLGLPPVYPFQLHAGR
jgi:succinylarginine dihydrolase